jgi:hypothetical protein
LIVGTTLRATHVIFLRVRRLISGQAARSACGHRPPRADLPARFKDEAMNHADDVRGSDRAASDFPPKGWHAGPDWYNAIPDDATVWVVEGCGPEVARQRVGARTHQLIYADPDRQVCEHVLTQLRDRERERPGKPWWFRLVEGKKVNLWQCKQAKDKAEKRICQSTSGLLGPWDSRIDFAWESAEEYRVARWAESNVESDGLTPTLGMKPDSIAFDNPLLSAPTIHPDLKPLFDAVVKLLACSGAITRCYSDMLSMKASRGMPKADEWPDSPGLEAKRVHHAELMKAEREAHARKGETVRVADFVEPRWTQAIRGWTRCYREWCEALAAAKQAAQSPAVAKIMDAGESRPLHKWTAQTIIDLSNLAGTLHPISVGGVDGLGFIRCGLPPLPKAFGNYAVAIGKRISDLFVVPATAVPPTPTVSVSPDLLDRVAERAAEKMARVFGAGDNGNTPAVKLPTLKPWGMEAWKANQVGMTVTAIASTLAKKYNDSKITQPRVSEQIQRAKLHAEASGLAGDAARALPQVGSRAPARTLDPAAAEQGKRTDGKAHHLRERERQKAKDGDDEE